MSSIVTLVIVLVVIAGLCLAFIIFHNNANRRSAHVLSHRLKKTAQEHNVHLSLMEEFKNFVFGFDAGSNKLLVCTAEGHQIIDLKSLAHCRKQKKWVHIPGENGKKPETHLEKIFLSLKFRGESAPQEIIFYEYRHNSIFQMSELEQKADYWELVFNRQIS